jgi:hypothetical protein
MHATVASVGPYWLSTTLSGAAACHALAEATDSASPMKNDTRSDGNAPGRSWLIRSIIGITDGTDVHTVRSCWRMNPPAAMTFVSGMMYSDAATSQHANISNTDTSNDVSQNYPKPRAPRMCSGRSSTASATRAGAVRACANTGSARFRAWLSSIARRPRVPPTGVRADRNRAACRATR